MQLCKVVLRHGGSLTSTVPIIDVTPAEILVLRRIHGDDAVVDIVPTKMDKNRRHDGEWDRLVGKYDRASAFTSAPGEESKSLLNALFPGAMKKLPTTLTEIGLGHLCSPASIRAARAAETAPAVIPAPDDDIFDASTAAVEDVVDDDAVVVDEEAEAA